MRRDVPRDLGCASHRCHVTAAGRVELVLFDPFLLFHTSVLEPDLDLRLVEAER